MVLGWLMILNSILIFALFVYIIKLIWKPLGLTTYPEKGTPMDNRSKKKLGFVLTLAFILGVLGGLMSEKWNQQQTEKEKKVQEEQNEVKEHGKGN